MEGEWVYHSGSHHSGFVPWDWAGCTSCFIRGLPEPQQDRGSFTEEEGVANCLGVLALELAGSYCYPHFLDLEAQRAQK